MSNPNPAFDFIIGGIEDGIIAVLTSAIGRDVDNGYLKTIGSYGGELDSAKLREALGALTPQLPLALVTYESGDDTLSPATQGLPGEGRVYRHDCGFSVIVCDGNARGEKARRRGAPNSVGVYRMINDVRAAVGGVQFRATLEGDSVILNSEPMRYSGVEYIARLPELTAYAVRFETWFRFKEPDRTQPGQLVQEVVIEIDNTFEKGDSNLPGVVLK